MATLLQLIEVIEKVQPVLNKAVLGISDTQKTVLRVANLSDADADAVAFIAHTKYGDDLMSSQAGVIIASESFTQSIPNTAVAIIVKDAYLAYACVSPLFAYEPKQVSNIHPTAIISPTAVLAEGVSIGAYSVIGENAQIGANSVIGSNVTIDDFAVLGERCQISFHVSIAHHSQLGDEVSIHAHASIGAEGFGFAPNPTKEGFRWQRIAQLGRVVIGSRVRIGSNTCIDRGAVGDTVIGNDVIIDNLVQIAHNVHIGDGTAIAAKVGIAGSTHIGRHCIIGGAAGITGHITIADGVTITAMTMVTNHIKEAGSYSSGTIAMPTAKWRRATIKFRQSGEK
ncbi:UDP-3-O-(3-hydroxymyristoyl)glucosamine N-acyltransferase [Moraxella haemolytica]|uniref:UDP-3-O-(3-hydroxymyristoyl)glucosamine N-acyltransferase n=1 Tax=Moraxella haemolytica TaxID=2904119 RepID=UPI0025432F34|nr:UDP-3-O-(3-hydroxymyristoyl)glucosamine N-acyltransferase [Moraxella sp. ZY171148]WII94499.1 UDP-3-O-(3-hydroxymyristoyl)glucosamine N-acyltransferase [Moraxella sp. ZY171148]